MARNSGMGPYVPTATASAAAAAGAVPAYHIAASGDVTGVTDAAAFQAFIDNAVDKHCALDDATYYTTLLTNTHQGRFFEGRGGENGTKIFLVGGGDLFRNGSDTSVSRTDGAMSSSVSPTTLTGSGFSVADVGKYVDVAGASTGGAMLSTRITAYISATQVTLALPALVTVGPTATYTLQPYDANLYDGPESLTFRNITFDVLSPTTTLANGRGSYTPSSCAIRDYRGGNVMLEHVTFQHFDQPFWGVQSDVNSWDDIQEKYCHSGIYLGPRCDQAIISRFYSLYNDRDFDLDRPKAVRFIAPQFVDSGCSRAPTDVVTTSGVATITSAARARFTVADVGATIDGAGIPLNTTILSVQSATAATMSANATASATVTATIKFNPIRIRSAWGEPALGVTFFNPWFEFLIGTGLLDENGVEAFIEVGVNDLVRSADVVLHDPTVLTNALASPTTHAKYLVKTGNADRITVDNPHGRDYPNLDATVGIAGANSPNLHLTNISSAIGSVPSTAVIGAAAGTGGNLFKDAWTSGSARSWNAPGGESFSSGLVTVGGNSFSGPQVNINGAAGSTRTVAFQTAGVSRFLLRANTTAEGGSNAGSDLEWVPRDDAGSSLGTAMTLIRANGVLNCAKGVATFVKAGTPSDADFAVAPPVGTIVVDTTGVKLWVRTAAATWKSVVVA